MTSLEAKQPHGVLASPREGGFDRLTKLAIRVVGASAGLISLLDEESELNALCRDVVATRAPLLVEDAGDHPLLGRHELIRTLAIRGFAGIPLVDQDGLTLGALCVVDVEPRIWTGEEEELLEEIAAAIVTRLRLDGAAERTREAVVTAIRAEEQTADAETRYRSLIENIPLVTYMNSVEEPFRSLYMSPQVESLLGYTADEWAARLQLAQDGIHPDDRERVTALAHEAREHGQPTRCEFRFIARDGRVVWVLDETMPVRDATGRIVCYQGFLLDITEHKHLEEQLRQSQKMEAVGQLAGGIAHDFNNMLTAISGYAELLASSFDEGDPRADDVDQVCKAAAHAAALTRQLLTFSRKQVLLPQRLDVNEVVGGLQSMLTRTLGAEVELTTSFAATLAPVETDPDQLAQVVVNFALNGRDAMPSGGRLTIATGNVQVDGLPFVSIEVSDTGTGMDEETRTRVFEPFFTTKANGRGTGLGLATAYGFVTQSGGHIEVDSVVGEGSTFRVLLPAAV